MNDEYETILNKINAMMDQSYGCAESFVAAVGEHLWGSVDEQVQMIATGFSGGVGGTHEELCGGISGATMIAGLIYGRTDPDEARMIQCKRVVACHRDRFAEYFGTTRCQELRDANFGSDERNPCSAIIGPSALMLLNVLREEAQAAAQAAERAAADAATAVPDLADFVSAHAEDEPQALLEQLELPQLPHSHRAWIGRRLAALGDPRVGIGVMPEGLPHIVWHPISEGRVAVERAGSFAVQPFYMARYPITALQYDAFLADTAGYRADSWWQGLEPPPEHRAGPGVQCFPGTNNPRENVSWYEASAFCRWLTARYRALPNEAAPDAEFSWVLRLIQRQGWEIRLPAEWEWQQAATGGQARNKFPWGPDWDDRRAHTKHNQLDQTLAVGLYPHGRSVDGLYDMSGNVWEWCLNPYEQPGQQEPNSRARRVLRGGSWYHWGSYAHTDMRSRYYPDQRTNAAGFRVICAQRLADLL